MVIYKRIVLKKKNCILGLFVKTIFKYKLKIMQLVLDAIFKYMFKFSPSLPIVSLSDSSVKVLVSAVPLWSVHFQKT